MFPRSEFSIKIFLYNKYFLIFIFIIFFWFPSYFFYCFFIDVIFYKLCFFFKSPLKVPFVNITNIFEVESVWRAENGENRATPSKCVGRVQKRDFFETRMHD